MTADDFVALKQQLTVHEGRKSYLYDDVTGLRVWKGSQLHGHPTWGIGFNVDATPFCDAAIDAQYAHVLAEKIADVTAALPWTTTLPAGPYRALLDIAFNAGVTGLLTFHDTLAYAQRGDYQSAAAQILRSTLEPHRAQAVAALMRGAE